MITTDYGINISDFIDRAPAGGNGYRGANNKVLLHEPESCMECSKVFLSLYPVKSCKDHEGLDSI